MDSLRNIAPMAAALKALLQEKSETRKKYSCKNGSLTCGSICLSLEKWILQLQEFGIFPNAFKNKCVFLFDSYSIKLLEKNNDDGEQTCLVFRINRNCLKPLREQNAINSSHGHKCLSRISYHI